MAGDKVRDTSPRPAVYRIPSFSVAMNGFSAHSHTNGSGPHHPSSPNIPSPMNGSPTTTRHDSDYLSTRYTFRSPTGSPTPPDTDQISLASPLSQTDFQNDENTSWSSAIGRATTGKSGRVIERLMAENDRLKRDIKAESARAEELKKGLDTLKPIIESLKAENGNLIAMRATDAAALGRRNRKIEELKGEVEGEKRRREDAERRVLDAERAKSESEGRWGREVMEAREREKHSVLHAEILEKSHRQLGGEYRMRVETIAKGIKELGREQEECRRKVERLGVVADQMRQESERQGRVNERLGEVVRCYRGESEKVVREFLEEKDREGSRQKELQKEMEKVVGEMRWVMGLKRNMRDQEGGNGTNGLT